MTILEALKSVSTYPISDSIANRILIKRGLTDSSEFNQSIAISKDFELCEADVYTCLVSGTNISESGYSVSLTDKSNLMKLASAIYSKHGEQNPFSTTLTNASGTW